MIWWLIFLAAILVFVGIAYLRGKCDGFIAGYNTSSPEKQKMYDIERLRLIVACFHFALAALNFVLLMQNDLAKDLFWIGLIVVSVAAVVLANTWAKKKRI